jgi:hypothetical protein
MMVGTYRQHLACVAAQLNGVKRHRSMTPSSRDPQLGLASPLNYAANKSGKIKIKSPSKKEAGAGRKSPALASREGTGETFFLDILFHRMSEMEIFRQPFGSALRILLHTNTKQEGTKMSGLPSSLESLIHLEKFIVMCM